MTLEGVIYKPDATAYTGTFQLRIVSAPNGTETSTIIGLPLTVACDGNDPSGEYSTTLLAGEYWVDIPGTPRFKISAPTGTGTFALEEIVDEGSFENFGAPYDSWTEIEAVTIRPTAHFVWVREDLNGNKATFWRTDETITGIEGVDYVQDAAGVYFDRET